MSNSKPFLKWVGGKTQILDKVLERFQNKINNYYEPFLGGGSVFLGLLEKIKKGDIIISGNIYVSDVNPYLIQLYKDIQKKPNDFIHSIQQLIDTYNSCLEMNGERKPKNIDEALKSKESYYYWIREQFNKKRKELNLDISSMFLFLNKTGFRGLYREGPNGFNVPFGNYKNPSIIDTEHILYISESIQHVHFSCCSFEEALKNCKEGDFVYLDPPYAPETSNSFVSYTESGFNLEHHKLLFSTIHSLVDNKVNILMSNSDVPFIKDEFNSNRYNIKIIECKRAINSKKPESKTNEVLIQNVLYTIKNPNTKQLFKIVKKI